ncbi:MAG: UDP-N-acetylmuramate--alanine ligase [Parvularculaceae bacterium]|nr:UDP-N-acetylmuramate--alanine ligase [Parvularculaceae bacterium]
MQHQRYFFCGVGGSGMLPLASYLKAQGHEVWGSDRAFDQGRLPAHQARIEALGIELFPQDGSGLQAASQTLVTSAAVEATIPDVAAAAQVGADQKIRAQLLSELTNSAPVSVGVAGTSGKSTTTAMLAHILTEAGKAPGVINGAGMLNSLDTNGVPLGWQSGDGPFVCEVDESDGSIALYNPSVGVVLNISEDHKTMDELIALFTGYAERSGHVVLGIDSEPVADLAKHLPAETYTTFSLQGDADFKAIGIEVEPGFVRATVRSASDSENLRLPMIGAFNVSNALAAIAAAMRLDVPLSVACAALESFGGTTRRLQKVGEGRGVTVIDDFAHNPEKIAASIGALRAQHERLMLFYQPHGYGPLKAFRTLYEEAFAQSLGADDQLYIAKPAYFGGTVTITDDAEVLVRNVGARAHYVEERDAFRARLASAQDGDAVVVMGARDDTLADFAKSLLDDLRAA